MSPRAARRQAPRDRRRPPRAENRACPRAPPPPAPHRHHLLLALRRQRRRRDRAGAGARAPRLRGPLHRRTGCRSGCASFALERLLPRGGDGATIRCSSRRRATWRSPPRWSRWSSTTASTCCTCTTRCRSRPAPTSRASCCCPRQLGVVTTLHGTDITVVGVEPAFFRVTQFSIESSDRVTAVSRFLKERAEETLRDHAADRGDLQLRRSRRVRARRRAAHRGSRRPRPGCIMHASNFRPVKNIPAVIHVFAEVRRQRAVEARHGRRRPEKAAAEQLARELGVERDVLFLGNQDVHGGAAAARRCLLAAELVRELRPAWRSRR